MLVERFGFISPAITAHEGMAALAGNGARRYMQFQAQVGGYHTQWKQYFEPRMMADTAIVPADFDRMPRFIWQETPASDVRSDAWLRAVQLLLITLLLGAFTAWRLRRYPVV